jgi:hypothetical protein
VIPRPIAAFVAGAFLAGCLGTLQIAPQKPETPPPPVPERFRAEHAPELVPTEIEGCQAAPALDPSLYFCAKDEHWYRFAMNRWYLAFAWDGNWFPVSGAELPQGLRKITPQTEIETTKTREDRLEELERKLEELDGEQQAP